VKRDSLVVDDVARDIANEFRLDITVTEVTGAGTVDDLIDRILPRG
jgi:hypothetical protein